MFPDKLSEQDLIEVKNEILLTWNEMFETLQHHTFGEIVYPQNDVLIQCTKDLLAFNRTQLHSQTINIMFKHFTQNKSIGARI